MHAWHRGQNGVVRTRGAKQWCQKCTHAVAKDTLHREDTWRQEDAASRRHVASVRHQASPNVSSGRGVRSTTCRLHKLMITHVASHGCGVSSSLYGPMCLRQGGVRTRLQAPPRYAASQNTASVHGVRGAGPSKHVSSKCVFRRRPHGPPVFTTSIFEMF